MSPTQTNPFPGEAASNRFLPVAARAAQEAIEEAGGREVFFIGGLNAEGRVASVRVGARGNEAAVPALFSGLQLRDVVIHNHPSGMLSPSDADIELAAAYSAHGHGVYIVDNTVTQVYVVVEPFLPSDLQKLSVEELRQAFKPNGRLARELPAFEVRPQQEQMMEAVIDAFNNEGIAVIEAPTGVGKTLAYLLPAALWAQRNKERVVISTRTINLQEQIVFKDIPVLQRCLETPITACLVKGRGNYVCLRKLDRALSEATLFDDEDRQERLRSLADWVSKTSDGSKEDLPFMPGRELWEQVCSEADTCQSGRCPDQKRCFVGKARREVARADLIVVNHHMLFSDLAIKMEAGDFSSLAVLPNFRRLILDEAHSIEDSATEYFGASAAQTQSQVLLQRFQRMERGRERGLAPAIKARLIKDCPQLSVRDFEVIQKIMDEGLLPALAVCRGALENAFIALRKLTAERCGQIGRDIKWRLTAQTLQDPELRTVHNRHVLPAVESARNFLRHGEALVRKLKGIPPRPEEGEPPLLAEIQELSAYMARLERIANTLQEGTSEALEENTVRWIEIDAAEENYVRVARCPLDVGKPLAESVYANLQTVVMTSATLTVARRFDYLFTRLGLDLCETERLNTLVLDSPFDFEKQALLCLATDLPNPGEAAFQEKAVTAIRETLEISGGHALLLFTSFSALDNAFRNLKTLLDARGITSLRQGEAPRTQLLDRFRQDPSSVLFATDSFWEGVDVAGSALQCVILPRLPFRVPTEPILEARAEAIEARGGNAFMDYSVPQAVIKFRQGFGRLIRRRSDRGVILVLDSRVVAKRYGRVFLSSLPPIPTVRARMSTILENLTAFFTTNSS